MHFLRKGQRLYKEHFTSDLIYVDKYADDRFDNFCFKRYMEVTISEQVNGIANI